jgi:putative ABC transport system permease protein
MPEWIEHLRPRLALLRLSPTREAEIIEELSQHLDQRYEELRAGGATDGAARRLALEELREPEALAQHMRSLRQAHVPPPVTPGAPTRSFLGDLWQDVRYAARMFRKQPGFAATAVLTLALGIGANTAVFAVMKSVLLDALPYANADRLVRVYGRLLDGSQERGPLSAGTIDDISERQRSFESLAAFQPFPGEAVYGDQVPRVATVAWVEPGFFDTLGVSMAFGRTFHSEDSTSGLVPLSGGQLGPDTARTVILTHAAWQRLFAEDPGIVGRVVRINGIPRTVIGVLPRDFVGPMGQTDFYLAFDLGPVLGNPVTVRRAQWLGLVGRLRPRVTQKAAQDEVAGIWTDLAREYPEDNGSLGISTMPLRDAMVGDTRKPLLVLMASAAFVLLIACANLAGAMLLRSLSRRKEFSVRVALGAARRRLVRQLLTESTVLAVAGGVAAWLLARFMLFLLRGLALPVLPPHAELSLDAGTMLLTAGLALCTGLAFGLAPAISVDRLKVSATLHDETRAATESRRSRWMRGALVAGQLALCVSLLTGAGLLARSLWKMTTAPLGLEPAGVLTAAVRLPTREYPTPETRARFLEQFAGRLRILPGVDAVATANSVPTAVPSRVSFSIEGAAAKDAQPFVLFASVSDDYFRTLRIPLRQGRTFDAQDRASAPPTVVISESMARRYWPAGEALGARIRMGANPNSPLMAVVGIVGDVRNDPARADAEPMAYRSSRQVPAPVVRVLIRTQGDPLALVRPVERQLAALNAGLPLDRAMMLRAVLDDGLAVRRLPVMLMTGFGALALLLASVGVYAMFASMAVAREREFGVRLALGSRPYAIAGLMLRQAAGWMAAGLSAGALGILLVVRLVRDLLFGVPLFDPIALGSAVAMLVGCATVALLIPVGRATHVDPIVALRAE